jgi:hypothetical protein
MRSASGYPVYKPCLPACTISPRVHDLGCPDIGHRVTVVESDVYRLDADDDGTGYPEPVSGH